MKHSPFSYYAIIILGLTMLAMDLFFGGFRNNLLNNEPVEHISFSSSVIKRQNKVFSTQMEIALEETYLVTHVVVQSDWWLKRPKEVSILDDQGSLISRERFPSYTGMVCGESGNEQCESPSNTVSRLKVEVNPPVSLESLTVQWGGSLAEDGLPVIVHGIEIHGSSHNPNSGN